MSKPTLYLMLGYPGAGKTTISEIIAKQTKAVHINSDQYRMRMFPDANHNQAKHDYIYRALDYTAELLLSSGKSVIFDANLNRYRHREDKYDIAGKTGARAVLIWVKTTEELSRVRATQDGAKDPQRRPFGNMPEAMFDSIVNKIEPPRKYEEYIEINGENVTSKQVKDLLKAAVL